MLELLRNIPPTVLHVLRVNLVPLLQLWNWKRFQFYPPRLLFIVYIKRTNELWKLKHTTVVTYNIEKKRKTFTTLKAFHLYILLSVNSKFYCVYLLIKKYSCKHIFFYSNFELFLEGLNLVYSLKKSLIFSIWVFLRGIKFS